MRFKVVRAMFALGVMTCSLTTAARAQIQNQPDDGQWGMAPKNYASTRYSTLDQITRENVPTLRPAFEFSTGTTHGNEAAPLVVNNTMYVVTPFPNDLYALDLTKPGAPMKWVYHPDPSPSAQGVACCDTVNRGAAYYNGKIYYNLLDVQTVAVDAKTGKLVWKTKLGDINRGESITMAPLVVKGKVLVGNSGGEFGVRGWLAGLDAQTGKIVWRAYAAGPDRDVLIGPNFKPFYKADQGADLGVKSWPPDAWKIGGAAAWSWISYDPDLDLVYYGTSNPGPWNPKQRPGDNKWSCTLFARRPETGEAIWAYQMTPHDMHDYDGINENILLDLNIEGSNRKVLAHPDRNGFMYLLDRQTGEVISAEKFGYTNTAESVNLKTGELKLNPAKQTGFKTVRDACPAPPGVKDWTPSAYSPKTGLIYLPHNNLCYETQGVQANYIAGTPYVGMKVRMYAGPGGNRGIFSAWDPVKAKTVWSINEEFPVWSGALVTAGDTVFYGTMDGWFKAVDATSGKPLWQFKTGSGIVGQPIAYRGPDGKEYVAVLSGVGGWAGAAVSGGLNGVDGTGALGFLNATSDLNKHTTKGGMLYVFSLTIFAGQAKTLRVCADPDNLPMSNQAGQGFENRLAEFVAGKLGETVAYVWWAQRKSFVKHSLAEGKCDVLMGVPSSMEDIEVTGPYYRSSYVFVTRRDRDLHIASLFDERLSHLRVGINVVGDDYAPPAVAMASLGMTQNIVGYNLDPAREIVDAVTRSEIDMAIVWGPVAAFFAKTTGRR